VVWGAGPSVRAYTEGEQAGADPDAANASGWNCKVHAEYEGGLPAVDWYVLPGAPVLATMDGVASMYIVTSSNAFDWYGVSREPYRGNPDRPRAPLNAFPGPGGGMGLYVQVENSAYRTSYGHLDPALTWQALPAEVVALLPAVDGVIADYAGMRSFNEFTLLGSWEVAKGDVIGVTGDSGYSEAPHLHYTIIDWALGAQVCPTGEAEFSGGGWLLR
jgi:murein DD-endopeptidase MepM/ murein hydrolase activator NlpD